MTKQRKPNYQERRAYLFSLIGGEVCRWCRSTELIEFDHIFMETKSFSLDRKAYYITPEVIAEVMKCQPLCRSCHILKTALERKPRPEYLPRDIEKRNAYAREYRKKNPEKFKAWAAEAAKKRRKPPVEKTEYQKQMLEEVRKELWENLGIRL